MSHALDSEKSKSQCKFTCRDILPGHPRLPGQPRLTFRGGGASCPVSMPFEEKFFFRVIYPALHACIALVAPSGMLLEMPRPNHVVAMPRCQPYKEAAESRTQQRQCSRGVPQTASMPHGHLLAPQSKSRTTSWKLSGFRMRIRSLIAPAFMKRR